MSDSFAYMLTGGHPNSLGRTVEVVEAIEEEPTRLEELYQCYFEPDEVVRLRTSSAFKRVSQAHPEWLMPYIDRFIGEVSMVDQASAQWTLAILFNNVKGYMTVSQQAAATQVMQRNLDENDDWIVLNTSMQTLAEWATEDSELDKWLKLRLVKLETDERKSIANRARKLLAS